MPTEEEQEEEKEKDSNMEKVCWRPFLFFLDVWTWQLPGARNNQKWPKKSSKTATTEEQEKKHWEKVSNFNLLTFGRQLWSSKSVKTDHTVWEGYSKWFCSSTSGQHCTSSSQRPAAGRGFAEDHCSWSTKTWQSTGRMQTNLPIHVHRLQLPILGQSWSTKADSETHTSKFNSVTISILSLPGHQHLLSPCFCCGHFFLFPFLTLFSKRGDTSYLNRFLATL